jgi:hypothetical protein
MLGLKSNEGVARFRSQNTVNLPIVKTFMDKFLLGGGDGRVCGLTAIPILRAILISGLVFITILISGLIVITVLIHRLAIVNAGIVVAISVAVRVITVVIRVSVAITVSVVGIVPPPPRRKSNVEDYPRPVKEVATMPMPPMVAVAVPIPLPVRGPLRENVISPVGRQPVDISELTPTSSIADYGVVRSKTFSASRERLIVSELVDPVRTDISTGELPGTKI